MTTISAESQKSSSFSDIDSVSWMWGDAVGPLGHGIAKRNPFRWSVAKTPADTVEELTIAGERDKYNPWRPVLLKNRRGGQITEERFDNLQSAVKFLKGEDPVQPNVTNATLSELSLHRDTSAATDHTTGLAKLVLPDGRTHRIKVLKPQVGEEMFLDIRDLYAKTGYFTFDPGFTCTGSCMSAITYIDGPEGICLYRGYPVDVLCRKSTVLEVAYLLLHGDLPDEKALKTFTDAINENMLIHDKVISLFQHFTINAHPMAIMVAVIGGLSSIWSELDCMNPEHRTLACNRLVAKVPVLAAYAYKTSIGQPIVFPRSDLSFAENWLHMMFSTPMGEYEVNPVHAKAIEAFMILHMDHEQNASTSTVRTAGSSQANPYACVAAGVASLWGPAHGGANEAVIKMLEEIGTVDRVPEFVENVKAKKAGVRLMGFGHRVYKNYDPRARYMKELVHESLPKMGVVDPLLEIAKALEEVALNDEYFLKRKLYPNVDYYSGILLRAIGIPTSMFTVMFAMARTVGWMAQWDEMISEKQMRISRPRQLYVGVQQREFPDGSERVVRESSGAAPNFALPETITR